MVDPFYFHWFRGLETGLAKLPEGERRCLLGVCGRACSESYSLKVYRSLRVRAQDVPDFFDRLRREIPAIGVRELVPGAEYGITYRECLCDLHRDGLLRDAMLCECSRQSLLYNLQTVFPDKAVSVELRGSILAGNDVCRLIATLK